MKTYRHKLYRNKKTRHLRRVVSACGLAYNHIVILQKRHYRLFGRKAEENKRYIPLGKIQAHLVKLKNRRQFSYLKEIPSQALQQVVERVDNSYQAFFKYQKTKNGPRRGPPRLRKIRRFKSFTLKQAGWSIEGTNKIRIDRHVYRYHRSQNVHGKIQTVTVKQDACGDWWISFACDETKSLADVKKNKIVPHSEKFKKDDERRLAVRTETGKSSGFDFGMKTFMTSSEGEEHDIKASEPLKQSLNRIAELNRQFSRKVEGSNNWNRARFALAKAHRRVANIREDGHKKNASKLCEKFDYIFLEDLNLTGMKALWGRKVSDLGFSNQVKILESMAKSKGVVVHKIDRWFPSSKLCAVNDCGLINESLTLNDREWICPVCGTYHDRDRNAARNIKREGASSLGVGNVRPCVSLAVPA